MHGNWQEQGWAKCATNFLSDGGWKFPTKLKKKKSKLIYLLTNK